MSERKWFKGRAALEVDDWYSGGNIESNLSDASDLLERDQSFAEIVDELSAEDRWNRDDFPHPKGNHALQGDEFERVTRQGYLKAISLARRHDPPVPIKTFWMTGVGNDHFEMHVSDGNEDVSVTLLVPEVDGGSKSPKSPESWIVYIDDDGQVGLRQTSPIDRE